MIKRLYAWLGRLAHMLATPILRLYTTRRVRVLAMNRKDEILLVRSWFGYQRWSLPGGGIGRSETPANAAIREVAEETGVDISARPFRVLGEFINEDSSAPFKAECLAVSIAPQPTRIPTLRRLEILDAGWFSPDKLPIGRSRAVDSALEKFRQG